MSSLGNFISLSFVVIIIAFIGQLSTIVLTGATLVNETSEKNDTSDASTIEGKPSSHTNDAAELDLEFAASKDSMDNGNYNIKSISYNVGSNSDKNEIDCEDNSSISYVPSDFISFECSILESREGMEVESAEAITIKGQFRLDNIDSVDNEDIDGYLTIGKETWTGDELDIFIEQENSGGRLKVITLFDGCNYRGFDSKGQIMSTLRACI